MNHKIISKLLPAIAVFIAVVVTGSALGQAPEGALTLKWRWFAAPVILAIITTCIITFLVFRRVTSMRGSIYWFKANLVSTVFWLCITLGMTLASTPAGGAFWEGLLPLGWLPVAMTLLFFVLSYLDDTNFPLKPGPWIAVIVATNFLLFFAGMTDLVETHHPNSSVETYYGFQAKPGDYFVLTTLWVLAVCLTSLVLLIKAYRRAVNPVRKAQLRSLLIGFGQYLVIAIVNDIILYGLFPQNIPPGSTVYVTILNIFIAYAIIKHGVFTFSPASLSAPILENLAEGVVGVNTAGRVEFANSGAQHIFGLDAAHFEALPMDKLFTQKDTSLLQEKLAANQQDFTLEDLKAAGSGIPVVLRVTQIYDDVQKLAGYIFVVQNVTELKKKTVELAHEKESVERKVILRTKQLHEEQARLRASIEDLALGFILIDSKDNIVIQNKALQTIFGTGSKVESLDSLAHGTLHFNVLSDVDHVKRTHKPVEGKEITAGEKILRVFITPITTIADDTEEFVGMVILVEDITEVKVLERSRDEFFSIASHELRTPLTTIRGNSQMAIDYYPEVKQNTDLHQIVEDVHDSSVRLIEIVNDFLDMSGLEQGKIAFDFAEYSIEEIIETILYELKTTINEKHIYAKFDHMQLDSLPKVWVDKNRVKQILYNVVGNAVKFTEKGGVTIHTSEAKGFVNIEVTDTGRGIPVEARKLLFRKFQQAGDSLLTRDTMRGTGLGLYIAQLLATKMGGNITLVHSEKDKGSTFRIQLPIASPARVKATEKEITQIEASTGLTIKEPPKPPTGGNA